MRLAQRPIGLPTKDNWEFTTEDVVTASEEGDVIVKVNSLSLDPAMRGWMNDAKSYIRPVAIGEVMRAGGVGEVIESKNSKFQVGDAVTGMFGVQQYSHLSSKAAKYAALTKVDLNMGTQEQWLNVLGKSYMLNDLSIMILH